MYTMYIQCISATTGGGGDDPVATSRGCGSRLWVLDVRGLRWLIINDVYIYIYIFMHV